jgi:alpha-galactosidase
MHLYASDRRRTHPRPLPKSRGRLALLSIVATAAVALLAAVARPSSDIDQTRTPPMGWNSWNHFQCNVSDSMIRGEADAMVASGMRDAGYRYIVIDDCWQTSRDAKGTIVADSAQFPYGIKALADYVHSRGLAFGIYTDAGEKTCQGRPGTLGHEQQDAKTYAAWGVDYVKEDWCNASGLDALTQYKKFRDALARTKRHIVLSICDWGVNRPWEWAPGIGNLWRTTEDIEDTWASMLDNLDMSAQHANVARPGSWNDPDMLEVGNGGMSEDEYRAHFSMWAEMAAPLIAGNDLRAMSPSTVAILTNREVVAVDQDPKGAQGILVWEQPPALQVWSKPLQDGAWAVALLNRSDTTATITALFPRVGIRQDTVLVRDLWSHTELGAFGKKFATRVPAHGVTMLRMTAR